MKPHPPKWAESFLKWFCKPELLEDLLGDLHEIFHETYQQGKKQRASWLYSWLVLRSFRPSVIRFPFLSPKNPLFMAQHNFKIGLRMLRRNRLNTSLNVLGITIGITCFLLLGSYVWQEFRFDAFHSKSDRIYRVWVKEDYGEGKVFFNSITPLLFENLLKNNFADVQDAVQYNLQNYLVGDPELQVNESVAVISPSLFSVFDFPFLSGATESPLATINSVILSESYATKYFGENSPLGKTLPIQIRDSVWLFTVSAIFKDIPYASSIQFDLAISNENHREIYGSNAMNEWFNVSTETYLLLREERSITSLEEKIPKVVMSHLKDEVEEGQYQIGFQPLRDIHLNSSIPLGIAPVSNPDYLYILGLVGIAILLISCINYSTLSLGTALKRGKEVGVKKVLGATQPSLVAEYLTESLLLFFTTMVLGILFSYLLFPFFKSLIGTQLSYTLNWKTLLFFGVLALLMGLCSGFYPAFVLSRFDIQDIFQKKNQLKGGFFSRKGMMVLQLLLTVFFISSTLLIRKQLHYLQSKELGYSYQATVSVPLYPGPSAFRISELIASAQQNGEILKGELLKHPAIEEVAMGSHTFGTSGWGSLAYTDDQGTFRRFRILWVDPYYLDLFDIPLVEGRGFEVDNSLDRNQSIVLNQAAVAYFGLTNPIGDKLPGNDFGTHQIIGVAEDFHFSSLHTDIEPLVIVQNMQPIFQGISDTGFGDSPVPKLVFRYTGSQLLAVQEILQDAWNQVFPNRELTFSFIEDRIQFQYEEEQRMARLISFATILSIIITSLGLLALSILVLNNRMKEIGIRKILGASTKSIFQLLAKGFFIQLLIAIVLSIPFTLWLVHKWLSNFAFQTSIGWWIFVLSALVSILLLLVVISYHTLLAARRNPIQALRME